MSKNIDLKSINLLPLAKKVAKILNRNAVFGTVLVVLLIYLIVVFRISTLANAEPGPDQDTTGQSTIPRVDKNAVNQIQALEQNNVDIHALFEQARNNPFSE
jgi:hypothetical protein